MALSPTANAATPAYAPRTCSAPASYAGPALRVLDLDAAFGARPAAAGVLDAERSARLDAALERARMATGARTMSAAVMIPGQGIWRSPSSPPADARLQYWASAGKAFTAVAILQLVEEGKISLDDKVSNWIAGVPNGDAISIRHLLNHTSGLFSVNEDLTVRKEQRRLTLEETLRVARRHGSMFCPGADWRYSNTGYTLLGAVLERVDNRPYDQAVSDRVISRLGRVRLRVVTPNDALRDLAPPAPANAEPPIDPRVPGAAGAIIGDADGMIAFWRALLGGQLLSLATVRAQFAELYPVFGSPESYGLGVMAYEVPGAQVSDASIWVGHSGGAPGVKAIAVYSLRDNAFVAVAISGDGSAEATANLLLQQVRSPADTLR